MRINQYCFTLTPFQERETAVNEFKKSLYFHVHFILVPHFDNLNMWLDCSDIQAKDVLSEHYKFTKT